MTPVGKSELLSRITTSRDAVVSLLAAVPRAAFLQPDAIGRWSVRDLLAHFVAHEQRAIAEIAAARRRERLVIDHAGTDEFNASAAFAWSSLDPPDARAAWDRSCRRVVAIVEELTDADFAPGSALEQALGDTVDGALANNTYAHYAEHLPALREFVARSGQAPATSASRPWWHAARVPEPYILPGLGVRPAPFGGHECYTTQPIPANTILVVSVGIVYPGPWVPDVGAAEPSLFAYHIENGYYLHPMTLTPDWYINHSCEPNAGSDEAFTTRAIRDIKAGEAITTDYELEEAEGHRPFTCRCGSPVCRGRIRW